MGRYYGGTITGKWAFGILSSQTPSLFHSSGHKRCYSCPMGSEDNDDHVDHEVPENLEDPSTWDEDEAETMRFHGECLKQQQMLCDIERDDWLYYEFDDEDALEIAEQRLAVYTEMFPGISIQWAKADFNDLCHYTDDTFGDEEVGLVPFSAEEVLCECDPIWRNPVHKFKYPFCKKKYDELPQENRIQFIMQQPPNFNPELTGTPAEPVCASCGKFEKSMLGYTLADNEDRKTTAGMTMTKGTSWNVFRFKEKEWKAGRKFTTTGPFLCDQCVGHWFWDESVPREDRIYTFFPECFNLFHEMICTFSFGHQLVQALRHGSVYISSEC